jgi:hypothetical protein
MRRRLSVFRSRRYAGRMAHDYGVRCRRKTVGAPLLFCRTDTSCVHLRHCRRYELRLSGAQHQMRRRLCLQLSPIGNNHGATKKRSAPSFISPRAITPPYDSEARIMMQQRWARVLRATPCGHRPGCPVSLTDPASWQPSTDSVHGPYRATTAAVYAPRLPGVSTQNLARNPPLT